MLMCGRNQHNIVKQFYLILKSAEKFNISFLNTSLLKYFIKDSSTKYKGTLYF